MPKKPMKILSIDFDYFQDVTSEVITTCYPDGKDLPTWLTVATWTNHYASTYDQLMSVKIDEKHFEQIKQILRNQAFETPCMAVQSHKHIYEFIKKHFSDKYHGAAIVNIDMHHDCFNDNEELDCGNWVSHIVKDIPKCQVTWIANKISEEVYGIESLKGIVKYDFDSILSTKFDLIFLCRSDTWMPPHLDPYFDELYHILLNNFYSTMVDSQITEPRNFEEIKIQAEEYRKQIAELRALNFGKKGETQK